MLLAMVSLLKSGGSAPALSAGVRIDTTASKFSGMTEIFDPSVTHQLQRGQVLLPPQVLPILRPHGR